MAFVQGLSGLYAAATGLDVVGNNLANASTVGFKHARSEFSDIFNSYMQAQPGSGTYEPTAAQQFQQGNVNTTDNALDMAINGNGMFQLSNDSTGTTGVVYTRNGEFHFEPVTSSDGVTSTEKYIVNANGGYLNGWASGVSTSTTPGVLKVPDPVASQGTTTSDFRFNLDDRSTVPTTASFNPADPTSFNWSTTQEVYSGVDGDTTAHTLQLYFAKTDTPNTWTVHTRLDGQVPTEEAAGGRTVTFSTAGLIASGGEFTVSGALTAQTTSVDGTTGATIQNDPESVPVTIDVNLGLSTQFATGFEAQRNEQDGYEDGYLTSIEIEDDGTITGTYSNGQDLTAGRVALATFDNLNGLQSLGANVWRETTASGAANTDRTENGGRFGVVDNYRLEQSTVDTATQLVDMITFQRNYQANAQSIKTQDEVLKTLAGLR